MSGGVTTLNMVACIAMCARLLTHPWRTGTACRVGVGFRVNADHLRAVAVYWHDKALGGLADAGRVLAVTRKIILAASKRALERTQKRIDCAQQAAAILGAR